MTRRLTIEVDSAHWPGSQTDANLVIRTRRRWLRLFVAYGTPPGSHIGLWHTDPAWGVHGWNLRVGRRYRGPCLTVLAHTRPASDDERQ